MAGHFKLTCALALFLTGGCYVRELPESYFSGIDPDGWPDSGITQGSCSDYATIRVDILEREATANSKRKVYFTFVDTESCTPVLGAVSIDKGKDQWGESVAVDLDTDAQVALYSGDGRCTLKVGHQKSLPPLAVTMYSDSWMQQASVHPRSHRQRRRWQKYTTTRARDARGCVLRENDDSK